MLIGSDEVQNMYDLWRAGKNEGGKYGRAMVATECSICLSTDPNVNKSVFYHWDYTVMLCTSFASPVFSKYIPFSTNKTQDLSFQFNCKLFQSVK